MREVRLRPVRIEDLAELADNDLLEANAWGFFGFLATNRMQRGFAADGYISDDNGKLVVEAEDGTLVGDVGWHAVQHGPSTQCRALNIGIGLLPGHRGQGYGSAAQAALATYLFENTLIERLEAGTDIENLAEQRALQTAGFQREGILRHAQFRAGSWRDVVQFSRLRGDPAP
jgi:RimJ/RimL family protein N-acetyltransferase